METDIGNPIEYDPKVDEPPPPQTPMVQDEHPQYYMDYHMPQHPPQLEKDKFDLFEKVDKSTWIIAFAVFLLGFFMGKTMQPVILRYT